MTAAQLQLRAELRTKMRLRLGQLDKKEKLLWDKAIGRNLENFLSSQMPHLLPKWKGLLAVYAPLLNEVDWTTEVNLQKRALLFPLVESKHEMVFYPSRLEDLIDVPNLELKIRSPQKTKPIIPEVALVPGLIFTEMGGRIGRGKGYYDRYLASHRPLTIGVAYRMQLMGELPLESQDYPLDYLMTEEGLIDCKSARAK